MLKNKLNSVIVIILISLIFLMGLTYVLNPKFKMNQNALLEDITFENNKINIYVFWGKNCPHCEELFDFLESIHNKYGKYYTVYGFEIWNNEANAQLMDEMLAELNSSNEKKAVPSYIIGNQVFDGYDRSYDSKIKEAIISEYNNRENLLKFENIIQKK